MKLDGMKCFYCAGRNTHAYQLEKATLWDDKLYESMEKQFGENRLVSNSCENVIYRCICGDCGQHFSAMVKLKIEINEIILMETTGELIALKENSEELI